MSDVNANINISINSQQALGQLRALQNQISTFNQSVIAGNVAAAQAQRDMTRNLTAQINATKAFTTSISNVETSVSRLSTAIDKNKLSLREYFRYGVAASGAMGKGMREHADIMQLAGERVKRLQTQYIALEQAHNGYTRSLAVRPTHLFNADSAIAIQRQQIFNKLLGDGSTALVNWGKNTQWAGRQLMVGFTVPLTIFGGVAGKIFMDLEKQVIQFKRVYGDLQTPTSERNAMVEEVKALAKEFTKYGIAVSDTVALAAKAAATGAQGAELMAATTEATRLATLGQIDYQQALDATISLQTAFGISSNNLAEATDFLNAVENQTVTSLDDITQAIPLVAPVIKGLGGDVKDLAIFMTAMREGGISANEGANALKSGLASLINPTKAAREQLSAVGINIDEILSKNKGDLRGLISEFGTALGTLGKFERQQTLAKMFGKYQFARMGALFANISKEGSQAARVMDLTAMSAKELGQIAEGELSQLEESVGVKFTAALEKLKLAIAPIGEAFLKIATPIIDFATKIADAFNNLPDAAKTFITWGTAIGGVLIPTVIMLVGLLGNFAGNMLKIGAAIGRLMGKTNGLSSGLEYLTMEELDAMAAAASLEGQTNTLTGALNVQRSAVEKLVGAYGNYVGAANAAAANLPQGFAGPARKMATGGFVAGTGNRDSEPALLMPGEFVVNKKAAEKYGPVLSAMNAGTLKGYALGSEPTARTHLTSREAVSVSDALQIPNITDSIRRDLTIIQQLEDALGRSVSSIAKVSNLIVELPSRFNDAMRTGVSQADFSSEFSEAGIDKYRSTIAITGGNFDELSPHLQELDSAIIAASAEYDEISDANIGEVTRKAFDRLDPSVRAALSEVEALSNEYHNLRVTVSSLTDLTEAERQRLADRNIQLSQNEDRMYITSGDQQASVRNRQESRSFGRTYRNSPLFYSASEITEEMVSAAVSAGRTAGQQGSEAFFNAFGTHLKGTGARSRDILVAALEQGLDPNTARNFLIASGFSDSTARERVREMIAAAGDPVEHVINDPRNSPHPAVPKAGTQDGLSYRENFDNAAGDPRSDVIKGRGRRGASRPQAPAEMTMADIQEEQRIQRQAAGRVRRGAYREGTLSPTVLRPGEEKTRIQSVSQAQAAALVEKGNRAYAEAMSRGASDVKSSTKRISRVGDFISGSAKSFGSALTKGSGKLTASMFALDGLVFGLSMMNNGVGEFAQKILPAVFALQGLQMMMPLLSNPMGLLAAGIIGLTSAIVIMTKRAHDTQAEMIQHSIAVQGSAKAFDELSKDLGKIKPSEQFNALISGVRTKEDSAALKEAQAFLETESGKGMVARASSLGGRERVSAIQKELFDSMAIGIIDAKQAKAIAQSMSIALKDPSLGIALVASISTYIRGSGREVSSAINYMLGSIKNDIDSVTEGVGGAIVDMDRLNELRDKAARGIGTKSEDAQGNVTVNEGLTRAEQEELALLEEQAGGFKEVTVAMGPLLNAAKKLAEMQSFLNLQFREGKITLREYNAASKSIQKENTRIAESIEKLINIDSDNKAFNFTDKLRQSAEALGMTSEELDAIDTQVNAIVAVINDLEIPDFDTTKLGNAVRFGLTAGTMSVGDAAALPQLLQNQQYKTQIDLAIDSGDMQMVGQTITMLNQLDALPEPLKSEIMMDWNSRDFKTPEAFLAWQQKALTNSSYFSSNPVLSAQTYTALQEGKLTNKKASQLEKTYAKGEKEMGVAFNVRGLNDMKEADKWYNKFNKAKDIKKVLELQDGWSQAFKAFGITYEQFAALPNIKKAAIMLNVQAYMTLIEQYDDAQKLMADADDLSNRLMGKAQGEAFVTNVDGLQKSTEDIVGAKPKTPKVATPQSTGGSSSGGTKENPYGDWWKALSERLKTFTNMNKVMNGLKKEKNKFEKALPELQYKGSLVDQMRKAGLSEMMISDLLSKGYDNAKKIFETLKKKGKIKVSDLGFTIGGVGERTSELLGENRTNRKTLAARKNLESQGLDNDVIDKILENEYAVELYSKAVNKNTKAWQDNINAAKSVVASNKEIEDSTMSLEDALSSATNLIDQVFSAMENQINLNFENIVGPLEKQVSANEDLIDLYQDQIDAKEEQVNDQQRLNDLDQQAIDNYNRDIEMQNRKIDGLRREDEIRQRTADALQKELELMSRSEQTIRDTYQKRIEALDAVAKLNDRILQSQQDQLNIGKALSEGDVYAAAQAAAEMQRNSVQYAADQNRAALEQGMENQIAGLRTSGGLTRAQAEAQIQAIQDQSYQTSLAIREIEDYIYNLKQTKILPLEDAIYNRNLTIRDLQNEIYDINENNIEPLEIANEKLQDQIKAQERIRDLALEEMVIGEFTKAAWEQRKNELNLATLQAELNAIALNKIAQKYRDIADAARAAAAEIAKVPGATATDPATGSATGTAGTTASLSSIDTSATNPLWIEWAKSAGFANGGNVMKYAAGSVIGNGSRDSVYSMLTPGEYVIRKSMVDKYGLPLFEDINQGSFSMPKYGGFGKQVASVASGGKTNVDATIAPVYNTYSVNVNASTNANADDIANTVLNRIRSIDSMSVRRVNGY